MHESNGPEQTHEQIYETEADTAPIEGPLFSLIVCTVDRLEPLDRLFASLASQTLNDFEVVLVDQNEDERLLPLMTHYSQDFAILHVRSARGLSLARNVGASYARGLFLAFPDDDCWYRPETLENAAKLFAQNGTVQLISGRTLDAQGHASVSPSGPQALAIHRGNYLRCGNSNGIFMKTTLMQLLNGFDERLGVGAQTPFQSGEEADIILRAVDLGAGAHYFPELIVHHDQVADGEAQKRIERAAKYGAGFGALLAKHQFGHAHLAYRLARPIISAALALIRRNKNEARYKWAWAYGIWRGWRGWRQSQH